MPTTDSITCRDFVNRSTDLLEDALPPELSTAANHHAKTCPDCRRYFQQLQTTIEESAGICVGGQATRQQVGVMVRLLDLKRPPVRTRHLEENCNRSDPRSIRAFLGDALPDVEQIALLEHIIEGCESCSDACVRASAPELSQGARVRVPESAPELGRAATELYEGVLEDLLTSGHSHSGFVSSRGISPSSYLLWLIARGRQELADDPRSCGEIASLATSLAESLGAEYRARAAMFRGHVARFVLSDFVEADRWFADAESHLRDLIGYDSLRSKLLRLKARARHSQSRNKEALELYERALALYRAQGDVSRMGETQLEIAAVLQEHVGPEEAIKIIYSACGYVDWGASPRFGLAVGQNLADFYCLSGRPTRAAIALEMSRRWLPRIGDPRIVELHIDWSEGKILSSAGSYSEAARALSTTREGFLELDQPGQAAFIALDLSIAFLHLGRFGAVQQLAREMLAYFGSRGVSSELMASIRLMHEAAAARTLTLAQLQALANHAIRSKLGNR